MNVGISEGARGFPPRFRGFFKYVVLYVLRNKPLHGYGIMQEISRLFGSRYTPSPGIVYPTLQLLEDLGYVKPSLRYSGKTRRRVYTITRDGLRELNKHIDELEDFMNYLRGLHSFFIELGGEDIMKTMGELFKLSPCLGEENREKLREIFLEFISKVNHVLREVKNCGR